MADFRWGILGPGGIAHKFAEAVTKTPGMTVAAVASRDFSKAITFARGYDIPFPFGTYDLLLDSGEVDAVYIATPHPMHFPLAHGALRRKIPVLCEKPFTVNLAETDTLISLAKRNRTFLMEGMWTLTLPIYHEIKGLIQSGAIGTLLRVDADFCGTSAFDPESRLFSPALAGGALLDIGVYTLAFAMGLCGKEPSGAVSSLFLGKTGVDESASVILRYPDGVMAHCTASMRTTLPVEARIYGTKGNIKVPDFFHPEKLIISKEGEARKEIARPHPVNGYEFEAIEVMNAVRSGALESPSVPWESTRAVMQMMDAIRAENGLRYPFE